MSYLTYKPVELTFGTSGLRGLVSDMTDLECYINVEGFLQYLKSIGHTEGGKVYVAGDLRASTPEILQAVITAIYNFGLEPINCGYIPTPALAYYAQLHNSPCIMVTGSHIPDDRNGIKFYKSDGELLKKDELPTQEFVSTARVKAYDASNLRQMFLPDGSLRHAALVPDSIADAEMRYIERYVKPFKGLLVGKTIVVYQHSAVGRDILTTILEELGANVVNEGRTDTFIPIDTENVTNDDTRYFSMLAEKYPNCFAIVSTDGDSDRPFLIDEKGNFHRGDVLGVVVARQLSADFAAYPISTNDAVDRLLDQEQVAYTHTKIGSPYVIAAMREASLRGVKSPVGWEVNGGFLLGGECTINSVVIDALPTRDAFFPILVVLKAAVNRHVKISTLFQELPRRFTQAGIIDNFSSQTYTQIRNRYVKGTAQNRLELEKIFSHQNGFGRIVKTDSTDGIRIYFDNGDIAHVRGSGNAPQLRIYSVADTTERADQIVADAIEEPNGVLRRLEQMIEKN